ncbi:hypothetical protein [Arcticibacterium luteifluviistationis]|uniref:Isoquinoline 1-oxidoreductase subunit n=1 Tax=Arcticibacterium luteifluviistationis TaxID=1784714 RepID=A0A2Z4GAI9_9BACT|nr:hypothetical protein [Arcticibacterium luteifluviistationis]AWV97943.1 hypothetical protein DJ013_07075 [Arcticibacterium luteifluviistationis]
MNYKKYIFLFAVPLAVFSFNLPEKEESAVVKIEAQEAQPAFDTMMKVLTHKRCMNCHPSGDRPRQGEDSHLHYFGIERGKENHGFEATTCNTCHQSKNNDASGVPGAPHWSLAPISMAWEGKSRIEIAEIILDRSKNGNKSAKEIEKHMTEDELVLWAFEPGIHADRTPREKPPVSKEEFIAAVKTWIQNGAKIPNE